MPQNSHYQQAFVGGTLHLCQGKTKNNVPKVLFWFHDACFFFLLCILLVILMCILVILLLPLRFLLLCILGRRLFVLEFLFIQSMFYFVMLYCGSSALPFLWQAVFQPSCGTSYVLFSHKLCRHSIRHRLISSCSVPG